MSERTSAEPVAPAKDRPCPCGRGDAYDACCAPLHAGRTAVTAEQLMRSRYSAFAFVRPDYLLATWHPSTRPSSLELAAPGEPDAIRWLRLIVEETRAGGPFDREGVVTFTAIGRGPEGRFEQRERSRFVREVDGAGASRWYYVDGEAG